MMGGRGDFEGDHQVCLPHPPHTHNCRSEDENLSAKATSGELLPLWSITRSHQSTGPTGRVVGLQRGVIVTVSFLGLIGFGFGTTAGRGVDTDPVTGSRLKLTRLAGTHGSVGDPFRRRL
jgi:hypothetical protein